MSSKRIISKLKNQLAEGGGEDALKVCEDLVVEGIEEFVKKECFYELPTNEILKIFGKSKIESTELLCEFISRMSESKGEESTLLLNVIKREEATLEECIKILSMFKHSQICQRTSELFSEDVVLPTRDYESDIKKLQKENEELRNKIKEKETCLSPATEKPRNLEIDSISYNQVLIRLISRFSSSKFKLSNKKEERDEIKEFLDDKKSRISSVKMSKETFEEAVAEIENGIAEITGEYVRPENIQKFLDDELGPKE